jgi:hypothetical protein
MGNDNEVDPDNPPLTREQLDRMMPVMDWATARSIVLLLPDDDAKALKILDGARRLIERRKVRFRPATSTTLVECGSCKGSGTKHVWQDGELVPTDPPELCPSCHGAKIRNTKI